MTADCVSISSDTLKTWLNSLVGADTGGFESLGAQLFILVGNEVNAQRKLVDIGTLATKIEDTDLRIWHTTVETRLGVWLAVGLLVL